MGASDYYSWKLFISYIISFLLGKNTIPLEKKKKEVEQETSVPWLSNICLVKNNFCIKKNLQVALCTSVQTNQI